MDISSEESSHHTSEADSFILTDEQIKNIIQLGGTWVDFLGGLGPDDALKLRDSHVIGLLSNPHHVDKQKVTAIYIYDCKGITDDSLIYIADNFPQLKELFASNCNISVLPDDFGDKLKNLQSLYLDDNNISKLPASIGNLVNLKKLYLTDNKIKALPVSVANLVGTCTYFHIDDNPLQDPPLEVAKKGIGAIIEYNSSESRGCTFECCAAFILINCQSYKRGRLVRCCRCFTIVLVLMSLTLASISLSSAIQKQWIANGLDPAKQFVAVEPNCIIVEVVHIVNGRQKRRRETNIGCEDVYIYHFSLPQQHIEGTSTSTSTRSIVLELVTESELHLYQSIEHAIERGVRSCEDSDGPLDPYFHVGQETQCWRPRPPESESESESETGSSTLTSESKYSTQSKVPAAYSCGNEACLKVFDPQNDADVVYRDTKDLWTRVGIFYGAMAFMCFVFGALYFFSRA